MAAEHRIIAQEIAQVSTTAEVIAIVRDWLPACAILMSDPTVGYWDEDSEDFLEILQSAGWKFVIDWADTHWVVRHPATGAQLNYIDGEIHDITGIDPTTLDPTTPAP